MNLRNWVRNKVPCYVCRHDSVVVEVVHVPRRLLRQYLNNRGTPIKGVFQAVKKSIEKVLPLHYEKYSCCIYGNDNCFVVNLISYDRVGSEIVDASVDASYPVS